VGDFPILAANRGLFEMERYAYCNVLVIAFTCWISFLGFRDAAFREKYLFWPEAILAWRQYYRLITYGFLHLDGLHLLMNMVSLYFFGPLIERIYGPAQFLTIYLAAIIGGGLLALYVHRYHDYRALGASGGVAGIIFASILLFPGGSINLYFLPIGIPSWLFAIVYLAGSFYAMQRGLSNVGHDAHLGGALVGLYAAAAFHPSAIRYHPWWFAGISVGTVLLFIYMARNPLFLPLEGVDFTKTRARPARWPKRFSSIFHFTRRKSPAASGPFSRPERQIDAILRKISQSGFDSLTKEEKEMLKETSDKYRRRAVREDPKSGFPL
jgi:membrane associated rhomboid family serine protease